MSIGENLKNIRTRRKLTQGQLAIESGISINQISRIERGGAKPELETIKKLTIALNCSSDELIFDEDDYLLSDELRIIFRAVEELPDERKEMIQEFLEAMVMRNDMEKWVKKSEDEYKIKAMDKEDGLIEKRCSKCGGNMKNIKLTQEQKDQKYYSITKCEKCDMQNVIVF